MCWDRYIEDEHQASGAAPRRAVIRQPSPDQRPPDAPPVLPAEIEDAVRVTA